MTRHELNDSLICTKTSPNAQRPKSAHIVTYQSPKKQSNDETDVPFIRNPAKSCRDFTQKTRGATQQLRKIKKFNKPCKTIQANLLESKLIHLTKLEKRKRDFENIDKSINNSISDGDNELIHPVSKKMKLNQNLKIKLMSFSSNRKFSNINIKCYNDKDLQMPASFCSLLKKTTGDNDADTTEEEVKKGIKLNFKELTRAVKAVKNQN